PVLRGACEGASDARQAQGLNLVIPAGQLAGGAGSAENVDVQRLHEVGIDVADVLRRGQEQVLQLLLGPAVLQEVDPDVPAAGVRLPAEEAEIEGIDDASERFAGLQDAVDDSSLAPGVEDVDPGVEFGERAAAAEQLT